MIRVVIADDHRLVREGIRALLDKSDDIAVVGEADDGAAALALVTELAPDVLVTDISMPGLSGLEAAAEVDRLGLATAVVVLTMHAEEALARRALASGARGYVLKDSVTDELLLAIRAARRGGTYLSPVVSAKLLHAPGAAAAVDAPPEPAPLTAREREVLRLIGLGHTNRAIAAALSISIKTVERHRTQIMAKLDVHNLVDLVRVAIRRGLIELDG